MRFIKKQLSLWRLVLIIGVAAIAIPIAARVSPTAIGVVEERKNSLHRQTTAASEYADAKDSSASKAAVGEGVARPQDDDDYYERRREYWERRVERQLDQEEYGDEQTAEDNDADSQDSKATKEKASKNAVDDEDDADDVDQEIERRREYWRKRLDKEW